MRPIDADALIKAMEQRYEDILRTFKRKVKVGEKAIVLDMVGCVKIAPSIEPMRGEWIDKGWKGDWQFETDGRGNCWREYECSECGFHKKGGKSNFCPNCGAQMSNASNASNTLETLEKGETE